MIVLVCGGRNFEGKEFVDSVLSERHALFKFTLLVQGGARGADSLAKQWAEENNVPFKTEPANWEKYGKRAGAIRNSLMLKKYKPQMLIAFPGGRGTQDMINKSWDAGLMMTVIRRPTDPIKSFNPSI